MTMSDIHPLAIIASELPQLSVPTAVELMRTEYGIDVVAAESLVSERDQNFRLKTADGRKLVLKIANAAEDPQVTQFQIAALQHIERYQLEYGNHVTVPRIVPTADGRAEIKIQAGASAHIARVVTFVAGVPLGDAQPSEALCRKTGVCLAELGLALRGFEHPGADQDLLWDMKRALSIRELLPIIEDRALRERVTRCLEDFAARVLPRFDSLRWQVIHNDLNPDNILLEAEGSEIVVGIIDFGDMLKSPLVVDVAIAASYMRLAEGNPLSGVAACIGGYHSITPLLEDETVLLFDMIRARLAATIAIRHWRISERSADDPYLQKILQENSAESFLATLDELSRDAVGRMLREVCDDE